MVTTSSGISNTTLENVEENAPVVQTPVVESMKPEDVDGTISKDKAIALAKKELVERYGYDKEIEKIAAVEFIKVNSPANPNKWIIIFGDLDLLKPHEENFLNASTGEMEKIHVMNMVIYSEVDAITGELIYSIETDTPYDMLNERSR